MKKIILSAVFSIAFAAPGMAQGLPAKITAFLDHSYKGWRKAPGACENKKWFLTADFDGDGKRDYLVRIKTGATTRSPRLNLIAFFGSGGGKYAAKQILDDAYDGDLLRSSFSVIKKGTKIQLGEGEGPTITLKNDAASQYICQTDAAKTLIYRSGKWVNIYDR